METVFILKLDLEDWNNLLEKYSLSSQELWMTLRSFWKNQKYVDIYSDANGVTQIFSKSANKIHFLAYFLW